jgi:hypothetical protein
MSANAPTRCSTNIDLQKMKSAGQLQSDGMEPIARSLFQPALARGLIASCPGSFRHRP